MIHRLLLLVLLCFLPQLHSEEWDWDSVIVDRRPLSLSWLQEDDDTWILLTHFEKAIVKTYFKEAPPEQGFGFWKGNHPVSQQFLFHSGLTLTSTTIQYELWPEGEKVYGFIYDQPFERDGEKLLSANTALIERDKDIAGEMTYALFRRE